MLTLIPQKIILHHSASHDGPGNNTKEIRAYHNSLGWIDCGYHVLIEDVNGEYEDIIGRPWTMAGAHTIGQNQVSLGLCFVGNFNITEPPKDQLIIGARMVSMWMAIYKIPMSEIYPHYRFEPTDCPGKKFDMGKFFDAVMLA